MTLYDIKPRFQALLRPLAQRLANAGVTANQVTLAACAVSVALGVAAMASGANIWFIGIALWMLMRMGFNAIDGMLAREFGHQSALGGYLNELTDVISDTALYLPLAFVAPFVPGWVVAVVLLSVLTEYAGALGPLVGASRRYDGPLGKSDRALVFGLLALFVGLGFSLPQWTFWLMPVLVALLIFTTANRVFRGVAEIGAAGPGPGNAGGPGTQ